MAGDGDGFRRSQGVAVFRFAFRCPAAPAVGGSERTTAHARRVTAMDSGRFSGVLASASRKVFGSGAAVRRGPGSTDGDGIWDAISEVQNGFKIDLQIKAFSCIPRYYVFYDRKFPKLQNDVPKQIEIIFLELDKTSK